MTFFKNHLLSNFKQERGSQIKDFRLFPERNENQQNNHIAQNNQTVKPISQSQGKIFHPYIQFYLQIKPAI